MAMHCLLNIRKNLPPQWLDALLGRSGRFNVIIEHIYIQFTLHCCRLENNYCQSESQIPGELPQWIVTAREMFSLHCQDPKMP